MLELICPYCSNVNTSSEKYCSFCGQKLEDANKKINIGQDSQDVEIYDQTKQKVVQRITVTPEILMENFVCPKCRKPHNSEAKFCFHCNQDLEAAIIEYKEKQLPIKLKKESHKFSQQELEEIRQRRLMFPEKEDREAIVASMTTKKGFFVRLIGFILDILSDISW